MLQSDYLFWMEMDHFPVLVTRGTGYHEWLLLAPQRGVVLNRQKLDILYMSVWLWVCHDLNHTLCIESRHYEQTSQKEDDLDSKSL